jgi:hypothetical protein
MRRARSTVRMSRALRECRPRRGEALDQSCTTQCWVVLRRHGCYVARHGAALHNTALHCSAMLLRQEARRALKQRDEALVELRARLKLTQERYARERYVRMAARAPSRMDGWMRADADADAALHLCVRSCKRSPAPMDVRAQRPKASAPLHEDAASARALCRT